MFCFYIFFNPNRLFSTCRRLHSPSKSPDERRQCRTLRIEAQPYYNINISTASIAAMPNIADGNSIKFCLSLRHTHQNAPNTDSNKEILHYFIDTSQYYTKYQRFHPKSFAVSQKLHTFALAIKKCTNN